MQTPFHTSPRLASTRASWLRSCSASRNRRIARHLESRHPPESTPYNPCMDAAAATPDESTIFQARKFRVARKSIKTADGEPRETHLIRHPGAVVILPLLPDDDIVMIRNFRQTLDRELWELPAGTLDQPGEPPEHAAMRELEEEAGYRAGGLRRLCEMHPSPGVMDERILAYVATDLTKTAQQLEPAEQIEVEIVTADRAMRMAMDGTITDAKTLVTLFRWHEERRND